MAPRKLTVTNDNGDARDLPMPRMARGKRTPQSMQRPRGEAAYTHRIKVKLTPGEHEAWHRLAAGRERSVSAIIRELMGRELARAAKEGK